jgi:hypothetical protein
MHDQFNISEEWRPTLVDHPWNTTSIVFLYNPSGFLVAYRYNFSGGKRGKDKR